MFDKTRRKSGWKINEFVRNHRKCLIFRKTICYLYFRIYIMAVLQRISFIFFFILFAFRSYSQIFGGDPPSIKWRQINSSYSRVIFPKGLDSVANRITNIISFTAKPTQKTIGNYSKKVNIVLQN